MFDKLKNDPAQRQRILAMGVVALALLGLLGGIAVWGILTFGARAPQTGEGEPAVCRPCQAVSIYELNLKRALAADPLLADIADPEATQRVLARVSDWHRRCVTLMCPASGEPVHAGDVLACRAPSATLLSELAAIEDVADELERRSAICTEGGCLSTDCAQAQAVRAAFSGLRQSVGQLTREPMAIAGEDRALATPFLFDRLSDLNDTVISLPSLIASGNYAAAEIRLLLLRDEAHVSAERVPGSVEIFVADRVGTVRNAVDDVAEARRRGAPADEVLTRWGELAAAGAHLLVETAALRAEQGSRPDPFQALARGDLPAPPPPPSRPCEGGVRLVQSVERRLAEAAGRVSQCLRAASCEAPDGADALPRRRGGGRSGRRALIDQIASDREAAQAALRPYRLKRDGDVALATDLRAYLSGEAMTVRPLDEANQCLTETASRVVLDRITGTQEGGTEKFERVREHALNSYDPATWFFEAPEAGRYIFRLLTSDARGSLEFGRGEPVEISAFEGPCAGFTGTWDSDFGRLRLVVRDGVARGTYRQPAESRAGILQGKVDGDQLRGRWVSELGTGGTRLRLAEDGLSFRGTWGSEPGRISGAGLWNGSCIAPAPGEPDGTSAAVGAGEGD